MEPSDLLCSLCSANLFIQSSDLVEIILIGQTDKLILCYYFGRFNNMNFRRETPLNIKFHLYKTREIDKYTSSGSHRAGGGGGGGEKLTGHNARDRRGPNSCKGLRDGPPRGNSRN